ncbi:hypothetical protein MNBD_NITROSPINAE04-608 [hydrothermal vent metagenome]|uniref:HTH tetR-type domain-containing protein n=1 Tax=hydrothermal vent metagenome TaxID=652676 RepID=A0A3B1BEG2_9ZZZZ
MKQVNKQMVSSNNRTRKACEAILKAAAHNFALNGFEGARMDKIARDAGVNKAMLYYHIGDKSELYKQALKQALGNIADQVSENVSKTENPEQAFKVYVGTIVKNIFSSKFLTPIILRELAAKSKNMPDEVIGQIARIISVLRSILDEGEKAGVFRKANLPLLQMLIVGGVNFIAAGEPMMKKAVKLTAAAYNQPTNETPEEIGEFISGILTNGLKIR